ncbi:MAG: hypothetical protein APF84_07830 [Gracilibacter sp. BRH_c7a]|nr:MAG: hypothetical protein APF84_07830 [Gracilibacter sp. BRH_c7a]
MMSSTTYRDENGQYEFDFSSCSVCQYHSLARKTTVLSDVDFVITAQDEVIFFEYKNAAVDGAVNPDAFQRKLNTEEFYRKTAKKFYSSLFLHWACRENETDLPIVYILLIEHPEVDARVRKMLRSRIYRQLPVELQQEEAIKRKLLQKFEVLNLYEWQSSYPGFKTVAVS